MTDTASAAPSEREQFEAHMRSLNACVRLERHREWLGGHYRAVTVQRAWDLWQTARRSQPTPPAVVEPLTVQQIWASDEIMSANAMPMDDLLRIVRAVEAAHGIGIKKENGNG